MAKPFQIPGYKIQKKLGTGGMATVYQGVQEKLNRKVAIKILDPSLLKNETVAARFESEAETSAKMRHSNIISVIDVGHIGTYHYMIMEFLEETLKDRMMGHIGFRLKPAETLAIIRPICHALDFAHQRKVIHRDIKTDNIMFREDGTPVLVDFGIARALDSDNSLTRTGMSLGTPFYMSPEQCNAQKLDNRSDFYSLGVVLFEVMTGSLPYDGDTPVAVALKHIQEPVPKLPEELAAYQPLIEKTMAKKKEDRVANGIQLVELMDRVLSASGAAPPQPAVRKASPPPPASLPEEAPEMRSMDSRTHVDVPAAHKKQAPRDAGRTTMFRPDTKTTVFHKDTGPALGPVRTIAFYMKKISKKTSIETIVLSLLLVIAVFIIFYKMGATQRKTSSPDQTQQTAAMRKQQPTTQPAVQEPAGDVTDTLAADPTETKTETTPAIKTKTQHAQKPGRKPGKKPSKKTSQIRIEDDRAWQGAAAMDTLAAYQRYTDEHPGGRHVEKALNKINQFRELQRLKEEKARKAAAFRVGLRSYYASVDMSAVDAMLKRRKFFDKNLNNRGTFSGKLTGKNGAGAPVVTDHTTGLMWGASPSHALEYKKVARWIRGTNKNNYAGFNDWRLPTVEEAASLLRKTRNANGLHIDPAFPSGLKSIRTGDKHRVGSHWLILLDKGIVYADSDKTKHQVIPVRTLK